jgi:hypothetical protein
VSLKHVKNPGRVIFLEELEMKTLTSLTAVVAFATTLIALTAMNVGAYEQLPEVRWEKSVNPQAQAFIERGDELLGNSHYSAARRQYVAARDLIILDGDFPNPALYRIAVSYYYEGRSVTAADHLEKLASEASEYGDLVAQAWALADAAWINSRAGMKLTMDSRVDRLKQLLKSPYIPSEVRSEILTRRLGEVAELN